MGAQVLTALFTLATCLGAGLFGFQGVQALRYRSERLNKASAAVAGVLALAGLACFALRLGRPERLFGGFANLTSGITLALYAVALFVVVCVVVLVMSSRAEDGSVPAWCGWATLVVSALLVAGTTCGYLLSAKPGGELFATMGLFAGGALVMGSAAHLVLACVRADADALALGRCCLLACAVVAGACLAAYLGWFSLDTQAEAAATKSAFSMSTFTVGDSGGQAAAGERLSALLSGAQASLFWGVGVACGIVVPVACGLVALVCGRVRTGSDEPSAAGVRRGLLGALAAVALLASVGGGYALRLCLVALG
ncbi:MAG: hypothetical protein KHZ24_03605 [Coriobacteriia bacterium]|nr:hypothetical protein [Coriobacteriia bacterium]